MAITPQDNSAFMREVDDEVRKDQAADFWRNWGKWIAVAVVVGLAALGGWMLWTNSQQRSAEEDVEQLSRIMDGIAEGNSPNADAELASLADAANPGTRAAAVMTRANLALQSDNREEAVALFASVANDETMPRQFRDLALIRQTATEFPDLEPQAIIDRLASLVNSESPWFGSAGELTAIALMAQDKNDEAGQLWAQIAQAENVPETLKTRALQMAGTLGVDAVPDEPVDMNDDPPAAPQGPRA